jgi:hypothetical protein
MLHACVRKFNVTDTVWNFLESLRLRVDPFNLPGTANNKQVRALQNFQMEASLNFQDSDVLHRHGNSRKRVALHQPSRFKRRKWARQHLMEEGDGLFCAQAGKQPHVQQRDMEEYGWQLTTAALHDSITVAWLGGKIQHSFGLPTCTQSNW